MEDGERLASALPGCTHLLIRNGFHSDFLIEYACAVVGAIETMRWKKQGNGGAGRSIMDAHLPAAR